MAFEVPRYDVPKITNLLVVSSFIIILNVAEQIANHILNAGLLGSLLVGVVYGSEAANLISSSEQETFVTLGYVGLLLLVFEAGLTTDIHLLLRHLLLSSAAALTGVAFPIASSLLLLHFGYGYTLLQSFAAGAVLCSTSLGTTASLLKPDLRRTKAGTVLMSAALIDDVIGLIIASIISDLASTSQGISWRTIVRPVLVSVAFGVFVPVFAILLRHLMDHLPQNAIVILHSIRPQILLIVMALSGLVAGAFYAGTSELFGAYLAGASMAYIFPSTTSPKPSLRSREAQTTVETTNNSVSSFQDLQGTAQIFDSHFRPLQIILLSPLFFATVGSALPIRSLFSADGSHQVVWRGILYSLLMCGAKALVGLWLLLPNSTTRPSTQSRLSNVDHGTNSASDIPLPFTAVTKPNALRTPDHKDAALLPSNITGTSALTLTPSLSRTQSCLLLGLAMVARGEIALIVAQLARPILQTRPGNPGVEYAEPFAVAIWAVLVSTIGGAVAVGVLLRHWV